MLKTDDIPLPTEPTDLWTQRSRPAFLYVIYALLLWSIPMGVIAAVRPETAEAIARGMNAYLNGIPESLYALFATGLVLFVFTFAFNLVAFHITEKHKMSGSSGL